MSEIEKQDAVTIVQQFMEICRDTHQTDKKFNKSIHNLYDDARKYGF